MVRAGGQRANRKSSRFAVLALFGTISLALLAFAPTTQAEPGPYEPDDTILSAAGPLAIGQSYLAGVETAADKDFFYFYVTSPTAHVMATVENLGGGAKASDIDTMILDSASTPIGGLAFIADGEARTVALDLEPGKYFVEVAANEGFGDAYRLTPGGGPGAFGTYAQIAARCATVTATANAAQMKLGRATAKLQRTTARVHRSRYGTRMARASARTAHRKARVRFRAERRALKEASESRRPWCFIAQ
jgi:hypothetical protein